MKLPGVKCRESDAPDHTGLKVVNKGPQEKEKKTFCFTGLTNEQNFAVYNNSLTTLVRAIKERIFYVQEDGGYQTPFRPTSVDFAELMLPITNIFKRKAQYTTPLRPLAFAEAYQGRRRAVYLKAADENLEFGFNDRLAIIKPFVKVEKYNFTAKPNAVPRIIQPRDPRYLVETGRYIKPIEKKIYNIINDIFKDVTVYKGLNAQVRGTSMCNTWRKYRCPVGIGLDAKRFDQHVSNAALKWEHRIYSLFYRGDRHLTRLMGLQRNNRGKGYVPGGSSVTYKTCHNRASGDSNTSLGNVLLMCSMVQILFRNLGIDASLINDGDDCVIITERTNEAILLNSIEDHFMQFGFRMTVETPVYELEKIEFCQSNPVYDSDGTYTMVRNPNISLAKDCVALKPLDNTVVKERWLAAVGMGGLSLTAGMPIMQEFYSLFKRTSNGAKPLEDPTLEGGFARLSKGMTRKPTKISDETRYSFWLAFNISPECQIAIEEYYAAMELTIGQLEARFVVLPFAY